jgi:hypothetical protein
LVYQTVKLERTGVQPVRFELRHSVAQNRGMTDPIWLERVIEWYENESDARAGEVLLEAVALRELQLHWQTPETEPMIEMYEVTEQQRLFVEHQVGFPLNFSRYTYYLTAYTNDLEAQASAGGFMGLYAPPRMLPAFPEAVRVAPNPHDQLTDLS